MSMVPRDPFETLTPLRDAVGRLFEESFVRPRFELFAGQVFPVDIRETEDKQQYVLEASLPGVKPEDIQVTAEGDTITIRATSKMEKEKKGKGTYVRREHYEGEVSRTITLPTLIDASKVQASYEQGVLMLQVPKSEGTKPKQIPIKVKQEAGTQ